MKNRFVFTGTFLTASLVVAFVSGNVLSRPMRASHTGVTDAVKQAVVQAIQGEIYDYGCESDGFDAADESGKDWYQLRAYLTPSLDSNNGGEVIHKFMPLGEVIRLFSIESDGSAILYGHPEWHFPPTSPNFLTVYMDDDQLCQHKHDWLRVNYRVELKPSALLIRQAEERQRKRLGAAYQPHRRDCSLK